MDFVFRKNIFALRITHNIPLPSTPNCLNVKSTHLHVHGYLRYFVLHYKVLSKPFKSLGQEPRVSVNAKDGQTGKRCIMRALNPHFQPASNLSPDPESPSSKNRQESASNMQLTDTCHGLTPHLVTKAHLVAPKMGR